MRVRPPPSSCLALAALLASGCYLAHEPGADGDESCISRTPLGGSCGAIVTTAPHGVCRSADGTLTAFLEGEHTLWGCSVEDGRSVRVGIDHCNRSERRWRSIVCDVPTSGPLELAYRSWTTRVDPPRGACAWGFTATSTMAAEPWRPFDEANELCLLAPPWCGAPVLLELALRGSDPCHGHRFAQQCEALVAGGRIVLVAETAVSDAIGCETAGGDRVARCALPPMAAGTYDVVDPIGRPLGEVHVGARRSLPGRVCTPVPL